MIEESIRSAGLTRLDEQVEQLEAITRSLESDLKAFQAEVRPQVARVGRVEWPTLLSILGSIVGTLFLVAGVFVEPLASRVDRLYEIEREHMREVGHPEQRIKVEELNQRVHALERNLDTLVSSLRGHIAQSNKFHQEIAAEAAAAETTQRLLLERRNGVNK